MSPKMASHILYIVGCLCFLAGTIIALLRDLK